MHYLDRQPDVGHVLAFAIAAVLAGCDKAMPPPVGQEPANRYPLVVTPAAAQFGVLPCGSQAYQIVQCRNTSRGPIRLKAIKANCTCLRIVSNWQSLECGAAGFVGIRVMDTGKAIGDTVYEVTLEGSEGPIGSFTVSMLVVPVQELHGLPDESPRAK